MFDNLRNTTSEQQEKLQEKPQEKPRKRLQLRWPFRIIRRIETRVYLVRVFVRDAEGKEYTIPVPKFLERHHLNKRSLKAKIKRKFIEMFGKEEA